MADRVADLVVRLRADTAQLDRELKKTELQAQTTAQRMSAAFRTMRPALLAVSGAIAAGTAALGLMARRALESADNIGKAADRIGVTTESLQRLGFAADLAGVSQDKFQKGLGQFVKRLGEAQGGTGALITGLQDLDPQLLKNLSTAGSTEEAYLLLADAISSTEDPARRAAIAAAAFGGRLGLDLVNPLMQGSAAIRAQGDELERYTGLLSREAAAAAEAFRDESGKLATFMQGAFLNAFVTAEGGVSDLTDLLTDEEVRRGASALGRAAGELARQIAETGASALRAVPQIEAWAEGLDKAFKTARESITRDEALSAMLSGPAGLPGLFFRRAREAHGNIDPRFRGVRSGASTGDGTGIFFPGEFVGPEQPRAAIGGFDPSGRGGSSGGAGRSGAAAAENLIRDRERAEERLTDALLRATQERLRISGEETAALGIDFATRITQINEFARQFPELEKQAQRARLSIVEEFAARRQQIEDSALEEQIRKEQDAQKQRQEAFERSFERIGDFIGDTIGGLLLQQERDWDAFFRSLAASFVSSGIQNLFAELAGGFAARSSGGGGGFLALLGGLFFAQGGVVSRPTLGVVGEAGPEAVIPLDRLDRMLAQQKGGIVVNIIGAPPGTHTEERGRDSQGRDVLDVIVGGANLRNAKRGLGRQRHAPGSIGG